MTVKKAAKTTKKRQTKAQMMAELANEALYANGDAKRDGGRRNFTIHDLKSIRPMTDSQRVMFEGYIQGQHIIADGCAGTGKTYVGMYLALSDLLDKDSKFQKIIIVRSAVASLDIGFLPGTAEEKVAVFETPYIDIVGDLLKNNNAYEILKERHKIEFMPTSFVRGLTWDNAIVLIDEAQNLQDGEINSVLTRIGKNSRVIVCGDVEQNDLANVRFKESGFEKFINISARMPSFDRVIFCTEDIVRSGFVKEYLLARNGI